MCIIHRWHFCGLGYLWFLLGDCWLMYNTCDAIQRQRFLCRLLIGSWLALLCVCVCMWWEFWEVKVLVAQSCLTFCDPLDCIPPGSSVPRILQAKILEWVVIPFSKGSSQPRGQTQVSFAAKLLQSCPTLCDPTDSSPPGSSVLRILQGRILEWVAISFSQVSFRWSDYF